MYSIENTLRLLILITKITRKFNCKSINFLFFSYYVLNKLDELWKMQLKLCCIPDEIFSYLIMKHGKCSKCYVDENLYVLCNPKAVKNTGNWFYLCSNMSTKKYKVIVLFTNEVLENYIYLSESMKFNFHKRLNLKRSNLSSCFLIPVLQKDQAVCATEMKISLVSNPHDCPSDLMNSLLQNYFTIPKYLRLNDIFRVDVEEYVPETKYCTADAKINLLYFKVNTMKTEGEQVDRNGSFVVYGQTTLLQETNVNSYVPCKCFCDISFDMVEHCDNLWPPILREQLEQLAFCITPFLETNIRLNIKPVFLLEGPAGSGKSRMVKTTAKILGLHLLEADFSEVQSLTSAQTEAKLRIILREAENCVPCILMLQNIQIFGINSEGQKDDRVLAAFTTEINKLYSKKLKYPIIITATSTESDISIDTDKTFVETITMSNLEQEQRCEILSWCIKCRGMNHHVDLQKIAKMCSDFVLADFEALVLHAIKNRFKLSIQSQESNRSMELLYEDFVSATEYMQSIFSDQIGAPRVPKVHWEDIGGLADLKREIMRRIEMPLLNIPGMGKSGLLLYGPPGTGKTLLAKAVATECQLHFLSVKGPELLNMYVGQSEKNVRQVFERARAAAPCIIFFDELDSLAPNRGQSGDSGGVMDRVVSQLLAEMDGLESEGSVFIIAATNRPDLIDPALLRPGRFDKMLYVGIYSEPESQRSVLKALTRHFVMERDGEELEEVAERLPRNLTGADLYSVCSNAWLRAVKRILMDESVEKEKMNADDVVVKLEDFVRAAKELVPSVSAEELAKYERLSHELSSR